MNIIVCSSELRTMSVNAQVLRLKKQLEDAERRQRESEKVRCRCNTAW